MNLTVLGGSAAGPNAGAGCSGYLIRDDETAIVLDLGPGTVPELKRHVDPRELAGIVVSHSHLDHLLDLASLRYSLKHSPSPARRPIPVWLPLGVRETLDYLARAFSSPSEVSSFYDGIFEFFSFDPSSVLEIETLRLTFAPGVHSIPTWAMRVEASGGGAIGYTADTGPTAILGSFFDRVDLLVSEATLLEPGGEPVALRGHLTAREAGLLAAGADARSLLLTHYWEELGADELTSQAAHVFSGRIEIARPGLILSM